MKGDIILKKRTARNFFETRFLAFINNAPFTNCISKMNNVSIDIAEDLDIVMLMYNLLEYSKNYRKTTGIFTEINLTILLLMMMTPLLLTAMQTLCVF